MSTTILIMKVVEALILGSHRICGMVAAPTGQQLVNTCEIRGNLTANASSSLPPET